MENETTSAPVETAEAQASEAPVQSTETTEASQEQTTQTTETKSAEEKKIAALENKKTLTKKEEKQLSKLKLKVDGKEIEEELPFQLPSDPKAVDYMTKQLQMAKMGSKRAQDFSTLQKEAASFVERLRANPFEVLADPELGVDVQQAVRQYIEKQLEDQKKSPEQLRAEELEAKLKKIEEERETERKSLQEKEFELLKEKAQEEYDRQITAAIDKSTLPKSEYTVKRVADWLLMGLQDGLDITAEDVIPLVEEQMKRDLQEMFSVMPEDVIENLVGKDKLGKIRKSNIAKAKQVLSSPKAPDVGTKAKEEEPKKKITFAEFFGKGI